MIHVYKWDASSQDLLDGKTVVAPIELSNSDCNCCNCIAELITEKLNEEGLNPEGFCWHLEVTLGETE
tara:strand:- start:350 stop:553 length:204 start_codon:yes stop_codon:yes gene_type:complete